MLAPRAHTSGTRGIMKEFAARQAIDGYRIPFKLLGSKVATPLGVGLAATLSKSRRSRKHAEAECPRLFQMRGFIVINLESVLSRSSGTEIQISPAPHETE